jgi:urease accessory protein
MNLPANTALFTPSWLAELELGYGRFGDSTRPTLRRHLRPAAGAKAPVRRRPRGVPAHHRAPAGRDCRRAISSTSRQRRPRCLGATDQPRRGQVVSRGRPGLSAGGFDGRAGATLEWLPQETIVFSAAQAELSTRIDLQGDARLFYWDMVALGRPASGERFERGHFQSHLDIRRDGQLLWHERQRIVGGDGLLDSPIGLDGNPVFATLLVTGEISPDCWTQLSLPVPPGTRRPDPVAGLAGGALPGRRTLQARAWLIDLWRLLRPALLGREAVPPRIWNT